MIELRPGRAILVAALAVALGPTAVAEATVYPVNSQGTQDDDNAGNDICHTSVGTCTLRAAISEANNHPGADGITVPAGDYSIQSPEGNVDQSVTITGADARTTTFRGSGTASVLDVSTNAVVGLSNVTVTGGAAGTAGGINVSSNANLTLTNVVVAGNSATGTGGGIYNHNATVSLFQSTVTNNESPNAGGIYNSGLLTLTNSTVAGNRAPGTASSNRGGGIYTDSGASVSTTLLNSTVAGNTAGAYEGGNLFTRSGGVTRLKNTIVAAGTGSAGNENCNSDTPPASQGNNLESANTCGFAAAGDQVNKDPKLGPLQNNGGQTNTQALLAGSPALNAANNSGCPGTDQRGVPRPQQSVCDIGAFEFKPPAVVSTDRVAPTFASASVTRRWAVNPLGTAEVQATRKKRARRGGTFRYRLSEASRVVFTIERKLKGRRVLRKGKRVCAKPARKNRKKRRCTRYKRFGSFAKQSPAGKNTKNFSGRIGRKRLRPGSYRATLRATDAAGNRSKPKRLSFKIVRR